MRKEQKDMSDQYSREYLNIIERDIEGNTASAGKQVEDILNSTARCHGIYVRTCYMPKIFSEEEYASFGKLIETLYGIFDKVIKRYYDDADYRTLFGFDERLEKMILRCRDKSRVIPIARIDIFYNESTGDFKFCEFNTDGSSAMNEDRELNNIVRKTLAYKEFVKKLEEDRDKQCEGNENESVLRRLELFDTWVDEFLSMYDRDCGRETPNVAIVDFTKSASMEEFEEFEKRFAAREINVEICDITELTYDGVNLISPSGMRIDAVYRRAVTSDIMAHYDEVGAFIDAVCDGNVLIYGDFFTQIAHNKILYKILYDKTTQEILDDEERAFVKAHVPATYRAADVDMEELLRNKDSWILKPEDLYGSRGLFSGSEMSEEEWEDAIMNKVDYDTYVAQEFCTPYCTENYEYIDGKLVKGRYYNLTGLYVYNGKLTGIYSRMSHDKIISTQYNEMSTATLIAR